MRTRAGAGLLDTVAGGGFGVATLLIVTVASPCSLIETPWFWSGLPERPRCCRRASSDSSGLPYVKPLSRRKGDGDVAVDEILGQVLRNAVWERLDLISELANRADAPSLLSVARSELPRLTEGWRALLAAHEPDQKGNCPECSSRWRQQKSPCPVWRAAYEHLVAGGLAPRMPRHRRTSPEVPPSRGRRPAAGTATSAVSGATTVADTAGASPGAH